MHKLYERSTLAFGRVLTISREDLRREDGQGATEYGLVLAFVIVGLTLALGGLGTSIQTFLGKVGNQVANLI